MFTIRSFIYINSYARLYIHEIYQVHFKKDLNVMCMYIHTFDMSYLFDTFESCLKLSVKNNVHI